MLRNIEYPIGHVGSEHPTIEVTANQYYVAKPQLFPDFVGRLSLVDKELDDQRVDLIRRLEESMSDLTENDGFVVVEEPGEGIATIRLGVTAVDASLGLLNVAVTTKITGAGLGGAAMEGEMVDSLTSEQLGAWIRWGSGSRVTRAGFTRLGDAKLQINKWTKDMRQRIDAVHNPEPSAAKAE